MRSKGQAKGPKAHTSPPHEPISPIRSPGADPLSACRGGSEVVRFPAKLNGDQHRPGRPASERHPRTPKAASCQVCHGCNLLQWGILGRPREDGLSVGHCPLSQA